MRRKTASLLSCLEQSHPGSGKLNALTERCASSHFRTQDETTLCVALHTLGAIVPAAYIANRVTDCLCRLTARTAGSRGREGRCVFAWRQGAQVTKRRLTISVTIKISSARR